MTFDQWRIAYPEAYSALQRIILPEPDAPMSPPSSESTAQSVVRREAQSKGIKLFRNNVGVLRDARNVPVRFGLANDSAELNRVLKSGDLIGIRPTLIEPHMVGWVIGQFVSREIKRPGWKWRGDAHESAQMAWAMLICSMGGDAAFACAEGTL
jgi:hypothetical protein